MTTVIQLVSEPYNCCHGWSNFYAAGNASVGRTE
uniref:Uncharacterized protein n=1 Tax=Arundo donax TaxID=35708 RepID=A0A0A9ACJ4_ARUDO